MRKFAESFEGERQSIVFRWRQNVTYAAGDHESKTLAQVRLLTLAGDAGDVTGNPLFVGTYVLFCSAHLACCRSSCFLTRRRYFA